jgi:hypothetical protein
MIIDSVQSHNTPSLRISATLSEPHFRLIPLLEVGVKWEMSAKTLKQIDGAHRRYHEGKMTWAAFKRTVKELEWQPRDVDLLLFSLDSVRGPFCKKCNGLGVVDKSKKKWRRRKLKA